MNSTALWTAILPALLAALAIAILRRTPWAARLADVPNERSLHAQPRPRIGGLGILAGAFPLALYFAGAPGALILSCALGLALVSLLDDLRGLPVAVRLGAHAVAALVAMAILVPLPAGSPATHWLAWVAALGAVAWMTNLYNFMDGSDGLAGTMGVVGFGAYAWAAFQSGQAGLGIICLALASANVGFLAHNFPPARVFMGDAGAIPLGFLAGALGVQGFASGAWGAAFPVLAFSPFIVDASVTLLRRLARRERVWQAHRSHYYQRLVLAGWNPRRLLFAAGGLMLAASASALLLRGADAMLQCGIIFFWAALYALLLPAIDRKTRTMTAAAR